MEPKIKTWLLDVEQSIDEIFMFINETNGFLEYKKDLKTKKADIFQENQMLNELKSVGYNPILIKRRSHKKYLKAYRSYVNNLK